MTYLQEQAAKEDLEAKREGRRPHLIADSGASSIQIAARGVIKGATAGK